MDCWLCGDAPLLIRDVICDLFNTTIYIESCTALLQHYDLTHKWATQHNNLLSSFIECLITYFYLVHHHAFVRCTTCLVYAVMLLFGVCNHAFIWCMQSCFYLVYATMLLDVRYHAFIWCTKSCFYGVRNHAFIWCMVHLSSSLFRLNYLLGYEPNASWSFIIRVHHCAACVLLLHTHT